MQKFRAKIRFTRPSGGNNDKDVSVYADSREEARKLIESQNPGWVIFKWL